MSHTIAIIVAALVVGGHAASLSSADVETAAREAAKQLADKFDQLRMRLQKGDRLTATAAPVKRGWILPKPSTAQAQELAVAVVGLVAVVVAGRALLKWANGRQLRFDADEMAMAAVNSNRHRLAQLEETLDRLQRQDKRDGRPAFGRNTQGDLHAV